jgi:hypothetical protein
VPLFTIRRGIEYQDLVALEYIIDFLRDPKYYEWIELESRDYLSLDDIVLCLDGGHRRCLQVKHGEKSSGAYTWGELLRKSGGQKSLFEKWLRSINSVIAKHADADGVIITNRPLADDIKASLDISDRFVYDEIPGEGRALADEICGLGRGKLVCSLLKFTGEYADFDELEARVESQFATLASPEKLLLLEKAVGRWGRESYSKGAPRRLHLSELRRAASFREASPLPEEFSIPLDFVYPSEEFHERFIEELHGPGAASYFYTAQAGAGKSTFVSAEYESFLVAGRTVLRHHFFLSQTEKDADRYSFETVAQTLMATMRRDYSERLGQVANSDIDGSRFGEWLDVFAQSHRDADESAIILIDGLDHALSEQHRRDEAARLLEVVLVPRDGLKVVIVSQPRPADQLPRAIVQRIASENWKSFPGLDRGAIAKLLEQNSENIRLPEPQPDRHWDDRAAEIDSIVEAIFQKTSGLALHVRIVLRSLAQLPTTISAEDVARMPASLGRSAKEYYATLWPDINDAGRRILHILSQYPFPWTRQKIIDCLEVADMAALTGLKSIEHVLLPDDAGVVAVHASLADFITGLPEHRAIESSNTQLVISYLRSRAPEFWKWAFLFTTLAQDGQLEPIVQGVNREWLLKAIADDRPRAEVQRIMRVAILSALTQQNFAAYYKIALLAEYYDTSYNYSYIYDHLTEIQSTKERIDSEAVLLRASVMPNRRLQRAVEFMLSAGYPDKDITPIIRIMNRRVRDLQNMRSLSYEYASAVFLPYCYVMGALGRDFGPVYDIASRNANSKFGADIVGSYFAGAARHSRKSLIIGSLSAELSPQERFSASDSICEELLRSRKDWTDALSASLDCSSLSARLYMALWGHTGETPEELPLRLPGMHSDERADLIADRAHGLYVALFNRMLINQMANHDNAQWIDVVTIAPRWNGLRDAITAINAVCARVAMARRMAEELPSTVIVNMVAPVFEVNAPRDYSTSQGVAQFRTALISWMFALAACVPEVTKFDTDDLKRLAHTRYFRVDSVVERSAEFENIFTDDAARYIIAAEEASLDSEVDLAERRAERFARLASLASRNGQLADVSRLLMSAAANLISHGMRKDMILDEAVTVARRYGVVDPTEAEELLLKLGVPVSFILEFTDGDSTRYIPEELAESLREWSFERYLKYYRWLVDEAEDTWASSRILADYLRQADGARINKSLVSACVLRYERKAVWRRKNVDPDDALAQQLEEENRIPPISNKDDSQSTYEKREHTESQQTDTVPAITELRDRLRTRNIDVVRWLRHWLSGPSADEAYAEVRLALAEGVLRYPAIEIFETIEDLRGPSDALPFLIALADGLLWTKYSENQRFDRFLIAVKRHYPTRAKAILQDALRYECERGDRVIYVSQYGERLYDFLSHFNLVDDIRTFAHEVVAGALELTSALPLPTPSWLQ